MKASVVIPVYNTGALLRRMLESVLKQTEKDLELICVDDGSTDGSDKVIEEYAAQDKRVRLLRQKNQGPYVARSTGIMAAKGEFVYICDHDDRLHPQLLEFCIRELESNDAGIIVFGHDNRMEQGDFDMPPLPPSNEIEVRVLDGEVLKNDTRNYLTALQSVHIDQWAHVARRELAQSVLCQSDYNLPRTLNLIKRTGRWLWTPLKLYYYNTGNPDSLIKKAPTIKNIRDTHKDLIGLIELFGDERRSGDPYGAWDVVLKCYLVPNVKIMYNMIRRGRKVLAERGRLEESYRLFSILLYDIFVQRKIPLGLSKFRHRMIYRWLMFKYRPDLSQTREALTARVMYNKSLFEEMTAKLDGLEGDDAILKGVKSALAFQANHATCYYSSDAIESALRKVACRHDVELPSVFEPGSVLHVMTDYLAAGGHTRVVERWIARSPQEERHCVAVLAPAGKPLPKALQDGVSAHHGEITLFKPGTEVERALELRKLASSFERIVLHVFSYDIVPVLAFGTKDFKRPVFLFNHADHLFGLGVSITDVFLDLRAGGAELSLKYRGVKESRILHIPGDDNAESRSAAKPDKQADRKELNLPPDGNLVVSAASAYKYRPFLGWNFLDYVKRLSDAMPDVHFAVIGPKRLRGRVALSRRVRVLGMLPFETLLRYYRAADLVVDSMPFMSYTSIQDAVSTGTPVLSLRTVMGHLDWMEKSEAYAHDMDELVEKSIRTLSDPSYAIRIARSAAANLTDEQDPRLWMSEVASAYRAADAHMIRSFVTSPKPVPDDIDLYVESKNQHIKRKLGLFNSLFLVSYAANGTKRHCLVTSHALECDAELS